MSQSVCFVCSLYYICVRCAFTETNYCLCIVGVSLENVKLLLLILQVVCKLSVAQTNSPLEGHTHSMNFLPIC